MDYSESLSTNFTWLFNDENLLQDKKLLDEVLKSP